MKSNTIAAIATPMTNSGIGIIRISGDEALDIIEKVFKPKKKDKKIKDVKTYTAHYGHVYDGSTLLDECIVLVMKGPHSYTAEDVVEINCHGGVVVMKKVLEAVFKAGATPAEPGEFTKRAFLNGKMDLSQAEAVIDVIQSQNDYALKSSLKQLRGSVKEKISDLRNKIIYHTAFIESALDDPEHISIDGYGNVLKKETKEIIEEIETLLKTADDGRIIREGINTVILGKPNAGKSSLLNVLLGEERAIVTEIAGTTRDILQETINLQGISLNIIDTAGIRNTNDKVEKIGVDKAKDYAKEADLIIYVVDSSNDLDENDYEIMKFIQGKKSILLLNKSDLERKVTKEEIKKICKEYNIENIPVIEISAKEEKGIDRLEEIVKEMFYHGEISFNNEIYITNIRHKTALERAKDSLMKVIESIENDMPEDFYSIDLMDAYETLGSITGEMVGEDLVNEIFSKFCMGK